MVGQYIVYEESFLDRFRSRLIIGETDMFWKVQQRSTQDVSRIKKGSTGPCAFFETEADANKVAMKMTVKFIKARHHFLDRRIALFRELQSSSQ